MLLVLLGLFAAVIEKRDKVIQARDTSASHRTGIRNGIDFEALEEMCIKEEGETEEGETGFKLLWGGHVYDQFCNHAIMEESSLYKISNEKIIKSINNLVLLKENHPLNLIYKQCFFRTKTEKAQSDKRVTGLCRFVIKASKSKEENFHSFLTFLNAAQWSNLNDAFQSSIEALNQVDQYLKKLNDGKLAINNLKME
eukprot:NODE_426_length_7665_cov_0.708961.p4 type:complete len:197 gc:universal NODE_426_length_7665_cov_0.708961:7587-6997(-)